MPFNRGGGRFSYPNRLAGRPLAINSPLLPPRDYLTAFGDAVSMQDCGGFVVGLSRAASPTSELTQ